MAHESGPRPAGANQRQTNARYDPQQQLRADREPFAQPGHSQRQMWATTQSPIDPSLDLRYARNSPLSPRSNLLRSNSVHQAQAARAMIPGPSDSLYQTMPTQLLGSSEANPLVRFYNDPGPWNSQRIEASAPAPMGSRNSTWDEHMSQPNGSFQQYRDPARSEVESSVTGRQLSDSGYGRSYATKSALSADPVDQNQECRSVTSQIGYMQMYPEQSPRDYMADDTQTSQPPAFGIQDDGPEPQSSALQSLRCNWDGCDTTSKNQSEHRKHVLRHEKPYRCEVTDCTRTQGFSTKNDLDRHRKSKHKLVPTTGTDRSFRCAALNCPKKEKIWPRLDNFRQHCKRMHGEEGVEDLVSQSELEPGCLSGSNAGESDNGQGSGPLDEDSKRSEPDSMCYTNLQALQKLPGLPSQQDGRLSEPPVIESPRTRASNDPVGAGIRMDSSVLTAHCGPEAQNNQNSWPMEKAPGPGSTSFPGCSSGPESSLEVSLPQSIGHGEVAIPSISKSIWQSQPIRNAQGSSATQLGGAAMAARAEQMSKAIESRVEQCVNRTGTWEDVQKVIKNTVMSFMKNARKGSAAENVSPTTCGLKAKLVACDECSKTVHRHCDLRKHKKRHSRPYGCTYTTCTKAFGSKNDWKRHENSQHYQLEAWRCHEHDSSSRIKQCARIFYRREPFQNHLKEHHGIKDEEHIKAQSKRGRIGRNCQSGFWCGFCKKIVPLKTKGLDAWDERFNHIDDLHFKKGERIEQWYPLDKDIPKGLLRSENVLDSGTRALLSPDEDEGSSDEDEEKDHGNDGDENATPATSLSSAPDDQMTGTTYSPRCPPPRQSARGKHAVDDEEAAEEGRNPKKQKQSGMVFCCQCGDGPYNKRTHLTCTLSCQHHLCPNCRVD